MASRFDRETIREYFEFCQRTGRKRITSVTGLTEHAHATGNNDDEIREWLFPPESGPTVTCPTCGGRGVVPEPAPPPAAVCPICRSARVTLRFDFDEGRDVEVECACVRGFRETGEASRESKARERDAQERGARMLGIGEIARLLPAELKLVGKPEGDDGAAL